MAPSPAPPGGIQPRRGEIWFVKVPTDPPEKGLRPVVIVSPDARNLNARAFTVLGVPMTTTLREGVSTHLRLLPGETGLRETSEVQSEQITVFRKESLKPSRVPLRRLGQVRLREIAVRVVLALGFLPADLVDK
jgi:mRNA-degrading endonuclease toxin of MazEF toxin-antitoxin module